MIIGLVRDSVMQCFCHTCRAPLIPAELVFAVPRREIFDVWMKYSKENKNEEVFRFISSKHDFAGVTEQSLRDFKVTISQISAKLFEKWKRCGRNQNRFLTKNSERLDGTDIEFKVFVRLSSTSSSSDAIPGPGKPKKEFEDSNLKTKRRRVDDLLQSRSTSELMYAAEVAARQSGYRGVAHGIKDLSSGPAKCDEKPICDKSARMLTREEALAYYVDSKSTTYVYKKTRKWSIEAGHKVFPSLYSVRKAKEACYPQQIEVDDTRAEIKVQTVLDKTAERLVLALQEVLGSLLLSCSSFTLISKWGCDGSSGHSTYKQKFTNSEDTDEYLFAFSFVPLRLRDEEGNIVWTNPRPSSTMYCRPIKFIYSKETKELTVAETNKVLEEIYILLPTKCNLKGNEVSVKHEMLLTMIDGKVCNALTETSSAQKCFICGATPKMMNDETKDFVANKDNFGFGLSTLHAWIRCFECLLHISYRLDVKKWQLRDESDKTSVKQRSQDIHQRFKNSRLALIVDKPKPGLGNTNDGNTARKFFENPELSAEITGLDVTLIQKFDTLLRVLSSGYEINVEKFEVLSKDTRRLYINLYPWYYMPATVLKILVHSADIIRSALLPIGQLSEEARNKLPSEVLDLLIPPIIKESNVSLVSSFHDSVTEPDYSMDDSSDDSDDNC